MTTEQTEQIVRGFYNSIATGDLDGVVGATAEDIVLELPEHDFNRIIPYMGTFRGLEGTGRCGQIRDSVTETLHYEILNVIANGNQACVTTFTRARHVRNKVEFEIEDIHYVQLNDSGKINKWKIYFDSYIEVEAFKADLNELFIAAVQQADLERMAELLGYGANPDTVDPDSGLTVLMIAAGLANPMQVKMLLEAGASVYISDGKAGATALHKACQGGSVDVVRLLVEAGAFVDAVVAVTGHTPLIEALWFKYPDIVAYLLDQGAGLNINTHYGFTLLEHFQYAMQVNTIGKERLLAADKLLKARQQSDEDQVDAQLLIKAVLEGDLDAVEKLLACGSSVDERAPILNGFNDDHTPLLVACRENHLDIAAQLLDAGADINAIEPTFGAVPLHKATYNGHAEMTKMLTEKPGVDLNFQGATNGYTPLHDAIWHGFEACSEILVKAGARLDQKGHDGKIPLAIATEVFGSDHGLTTLIKQKMELNKQM